MYPLILKRTLNDIRWYAWEWAVEWKTEYRVGIRDIDEHHETLIECISSVKQEVARQDAWSAVHLSLVKPAALAATHFKVEESLMRIHDYPHFSKERHRP